MPNFPDQNTVFAEQAQALERRRQLARSLIQQGMSQDIGQGYQGGKVYIVGNPLSNVAAAVGGQYLGNKANADQQDLAARQAQANNDILSSIPTEGPERQQAQLQAMQNPSLRDVISAQMGLDERAENQRFRQQEAEANRIEKGEQQAAERVLKAEEREADRQNRLAMRQTPAVIIHQGGGGKSGSPGNGMDGKPLTNQQEKSALELGSNRSNLQMLSDTFKDDYAGDLRSTIQRKFGEVAGGAASEKTQDMTRWWANQAMFDELPQRHELFGATLTAGEKAAWASAAINPSLSPTKIRERLGVRAKIYDDVEARMRGSVQAGGKSVKQFDAAVGKKPAEAKVVRTGKDASGRKVEQLSDGTVRYAQ